MEDQQISLEFNKKKTKLKDNQHECHYCGHVATEYSRKLNSNMAMTLIALVRHRQFDFVHVETFLKDNGYKRSGDFHKLIYWRYLERQPGEKEDGNPRNGIYRITGLGIMFAEKKTTAKKIVKLLNNNFRGFDGPDIYIDQCGKFNYNELMYGSNG